MLDIILSTFKENVNAMDKVENCSPFIVFTYKRNQQCGSFKVWQSDREFFEVLKMKESAEDTIKIHPLSLGYYMLCRNAHRQGDKAKVEDGLRKLKSLSTKISTSRLPVDNCTTELIWIIQSLLMKM